MKDPLCNSSFGSMVTLDYVTPDTGYEPKDMELTDTNERNLATSSDIYFQNTLDDTASVPNVPDVDGDELAEFLAVVVDRTGQPVEVRSNSDQFSCDIRNLKSAQSQFPLVTQPKRMINQTGGSVEERIAEERESSNAQITETVFLRIGPLFRRIGPRVSQDRTFSKTNAPFLKNTLYLQQTTDWFVHLCKLQ